MSKRISHILFFIITVVLCALNFVACEKGDIPDNLQTADSTYETWLNSDLAEDFNGDRRITEEDYEFYKGYKEWKTSDKAYDYNGDKKIDWADYSFAKSASDYDGDGVIDEQDFTFYNNYKYLIGKFKVVNFNYQQNNGKVFYLNDSYNIGDLAQDIGDFDFTVSSNLKLKCIYGETVKQKLGDDEIAVQDAINSCVFEKLSAYVTTASFTIQGLPFTVYLTKTESGFSSSVSVTVGECTANITFDITYVE